MDKDDQQLNRWLDTYQVENADDALLESIIMQASSAKEKSKVLPFTKPAGQGGFLKNASLVAATALYGFWMGNTSPASLATPEDTNINFDAVILGPQTLQEVML